MDIKKDIAASLRISEDDALAKLESLAEQIAICCSDCDSVAIPGFGTFQASKKLETITSGLDGQKILNPPAIDVEFKPSVVLRKSLK